MPISDIFKNVSWFGEYEYEEPSPKKERRKKAHSPKAPPPTEKFEKVLTEAELKIELAHRFERSREYRIMLQNYQKKLRAREAELDERETTIKKKTLAAQQRAATVAETLKKYQIALGITH